MRDDLAVRSTSSPATWSGCSMGCRTPRPATSVRPDEAGWRRASSPCTWPSAAWLVFAPVSSVEGHRHPAVWVVVLNAVLVALFIGGIEGLLFGLLPLKFMPGHQLAQWSWAAWAAIMMAVAVLFVEVLLRPSTGYRGKSSTASVTVGAACPRSSVSGRWRSGAGSDSAPITLRWPPRGRSRF